MLLRHAVPPLRTTEMVCVLPSFPLVSYESEIKRKERSGQIGPKCIKLYPINLITIVQNIFISCADVLVLVQYIVHRRLTCIARAHTHSLHENVTERTTAGAVGDVFAFA